VRALLRSECLTLRYKFEPASVKLVVIADSPPKPRLYFYDPLGRVTEPLFAAMMNALCYKPTTKEDGLHEFRRRGGLLVNATYRPLDGLTHAAYVEAIQQSYPALLDELLKMVPEKLAPILLIKARLCRLLEPKLKADGFTMPYKGIRITSLLKTAGKFREQFAAL